MTGQKLTLVVDKKVSEIENLTPQSDVVTVHQQSELGEVIDKAFQNSDIFDEKANMSTIDFWSRIPPIVEPFINKLESASALNVIPRSAAIITRVAKRNFVSRDGQGRKEAVQIIAGKRDLEIETQGFGGRMANWLTSRFKRQEGQP